MSKQNTSSSKNNILDLIENIKEKEIQKSDVSEDTNKIKIVKSLPVDNKDNNKKFLNKKRLFCERSQINDFQNNSINSKSVKKIKDPHNYLSSDNIATSILRHFTNFIFGFVNQSIKEGLNQNKNYSKKMKFKKIDNEKKLLIKVKDIKNKSVKEFLFLIEENKMIYNNIIEINNSYDKLFNVRAINLFFDIYNTNEKEINLEKYGIKCVKTFNLSDEIKTINNLKEKIMNNNDEKKLEKLENIINRRFLKLFKVNKK
jgi:hypothetical protein